MNSKHIIRVVFSVATIGIMLLLAGCGGSSNNATSPGATPSGSATSSGSDAATMLDTAIANSSKASSVHAKSQIISGGQTTLLEGDFGNAAVKFTITQGSGQKIDAIVAGPSSSDTYLSSDGGQSWSKGDPNNVAQPAQLVLAPFSASPKLSAQGPVSIIGSETVNGTATSHMQIAARSPIDVWIGDNKGQQVVYKIHVLSTDSTGSNYDVTTDYSNYGAALDIQTPVVIGPSFSGSAQTPTP